MKQEVFQSSFPGFPTDKKSLEKLGKLLIQNKLLEKIEWDRLVLKKPEPDLLVWAVAALDQVTPEELAKIEADILNVQYIDLEKTTISPTTFKILDSKIINERKIIPVRVDDDMLIVGCVDPSDKTLFEDISTPYNLVPSKILLSHFEKMFDKLTGKKKRIGDILIELKFITKQLLEESLGKAKEEKLRLGAYLVKYNHITNKQLSIVLSKQFHTDYIDLTVDQVDPLLTALIPKKICYDHILCPVKKENNKLVIAMTDPTDIITIDHMEMMTGMRITPIVSSELSIISALGSLYGESVDSLEGDDAEGSEDLGNIDSLREDDAPIIKLVNVLLTQAVEMNVSDVHIEVYESELRIRFRQDGTLKLHMTPAKGAHAGLVSRIKVMASLDIAENRRPQDGRIKLNMKDRKVDLRVSCIPCVWGEKVVMRLCDQGNLQVDLTQLGFEPFVLDRFMEGIKCSNGIVLVTGPTGSGKTTTLYSSLFLLNDPAVNIMTAEDPVEYNLMGVNQVQCHADIGLDFSAALRSFLRQDPDIIMLGEIRDFETASIAIKAAMTGHLVVSTLHTNDAPSTVARLLNMGIEPFGLSSSLRIVQAQRLVKRICPTCTEVYKPSKDMLMTLGINKELLAKLKLNIDINKLEFKKGQGCPDCDGSGYKGRRGIYEVLEVTNEFRELIEGSATTEEMRRQALKDGMLSLRESALYKLITGVTTVQEVFDTTIDAGGQSDAAATAKTFVPSPSATQQASDIPPNMQSLATEIKKFTELVSGFSSPQVLCENPDLLNKNIAQPLAFIKEQAAKTKDAAKLIPLIQAQGQKMEFNVKNLLSHISESKINFKRIQLNQLIEKEVFLKLKHHLMTAKLLTGNKNIGQNLKVVKNLMPNLPPVNIDPANFATVISNLVVNSLIALGSKGGEFKVITRVKPKSNKHIELIVFDSGKGISAENQKRLFIPFTPIEQNTMGLGLSVSKKIVNSHRGNIFFKSSPKTNTFVIIELPISV